MFEYPLTVLTWSRDTAEAPPNMASYGNLHISVTMLKISINCFIGVYFVMKITKYTNINLENQTRIS